MTIKIFSTYATNGKCICICILLGTHVTMTYMAVTIENNENNIVKCLTLNEKEFHELNTTVYDQPPPPHDHLPWESMPPTGKIFDLCLAMRVLYRGGSRGAWGPGPPRPPKMRPQHQNSTKLRPQNGSFRPVTIWAPPPDQILDPPLVVCQFSKNK